MKDVLHVAMNGELIGQWFKSRDGHTEFHYEDSWLDILQEIVMFSKDIGSISVSDLDSQVSESILEGFQQKIHQLS